MKRYTPLLICACAVALAGCQITNPRAGASVSVGTDGVHVSPHVGVGIGKARVGVGL